MATRIDRAITNDRSKRRIMLICDPYRMRFCMKIITKTFIALLSTLTAYAAEAATPAEQYIQFCTTCHLPGVHGAPKVGDREDWTQRLRPGLNSVYRNAINGIPNTAMLARGGQAAMSDTEIRAVVDYMIAATGLPASVLRDAARYDKLGLTDRDFIRRDTSRDGFLSRPELADDPVLANAFARFDTNKDGRLGEAEFRNAETVLEQERIAVAVDDATLNAAVRKALSAVKGIRVDDIRIDINSGALVMSGTVAQAGMAIRAQDAVKRVNGVKTINNRLVSADQLGWD